MFVFNCYFTNIFFFVESTENSKKRKSITSSICYLITYFGMNVIIFVLIFFIHACGKFHVLNIYVMKLD